jgi:hypothetical protein
MTAQQRLQRIEQRATVDIIRMGISEVADVRFFAKEMNHRLADLVNLARELTEENKRLRDKVARYIREARHHRRQWLLWGNLAVDSVMENKRLREALRHIERTGTVSSKRIAREALKEDR